MRFQSLITTLLALLLSVQFACAHPTPTEALIWRRIRRTTSDSPTDQRPGFPNRPPVSEIVHEQHASFFEGSPGQEGTVVEGER